MQLRMYEYHVYPSTKQKVRLISSFKTSKAIYNELLALNADIYKFGGISLGKFDFNKYLAGKFPEIHSQVKQNVSDRVYKAFSNFFRRVKDKSYKKKGFPRFKSRVNSITYPQSGFKILYDKRIEISKVGSIPTVLHRMPQGKIKTLTIKQNRAGQWHAIFACEMPDIQIKHPSVSKVGIDVGLESFATLSNGEFVANPRHIVKAEKRLKMLQRRLSRKVKGSTNKRKAIYKLAKQHLKISNQRNDFLHKLSHRLTKSHAFIAIEDLNIKNMIRNHSLAKHINDASWNAFAQMLSYKAVTCGGQLVKVDPRNTSRTCSRCGATQDVTLNQREFICLNCGFVAHRDLNAANNILKVGTDCAELNACEHNVRPTLLAVVDEAGTTIGNS